ncbi:M15 family metallopeptidase, partial [bacterium]
TKELHVPNQTNKSNIINTVKSVQNNLDNLVDIKSINNNILVDLAYSKKDNFLNEDVYEDLQVCYLQKEAAEKLSKAQNILERRHPGLSLLVYDGLRSRNIQYKMWEIVKNTNKQKYVANPEKGSIHNYGAAVDLTIADQNGKPLDMGTDFDFFGELSQPRYEEKYLKNNELTQKQVKNRQLLRSVMTEAGFFEISIEWWHFNAYSSTEVKSRYRIVEFLLSNDEKNKVLQNVKDLPRDENGYCLIVSGTTRKLYVIKEDEIQFVFDVAIGQKGLGKSKEGDRKTPVGDYKIKWMLSRNGSDKQNPGGVSSKVIDGQTYAVLDTELFFGDLSKIRVKVLPDGMRKVSNDPNDRLITKKEIEIAQDEKLWTNSYGGSNVYVMALDYPNKKDKNEGKTGSCIEIHASANLEKIGYKNYPGTYGCIAMYSAYAKKIYELVNPDTWVRII